MQGWEAAQGLAAQRAEQLTQRILALDGELSVLESEMMQGMLAASAEPAAAAQLVGQLSSWDAVLARLETGALQVTPRRVQGFGHKTPQIVVKYLTSPLVQPSPPQSDAHPQSGSS